MTTPEEVDRMTHPALRIEVPYFSAANADISEAVKASPTGAVRVYMLGPSGWDTDETADVCTLDEHGNVVCVDSGTA